VAAEGARQPAHPSQRTRAKPAKVINSEPSTWVSTVAIAQHLSQTGNLIQIYSDRALFDNMVAGATQE